MALSFIFFKSLLKHHLITQVFLVTVYKSVSLCSHSVCYFISFSSSAYYPLNNFGKSVYLLTFPPQLEHDSMKAGTFICLLLISRNLTSDFSLQAQSLFE